MSVKKGGMFKEFLIVLVLAALAALVVAIKDGIWKEFTNEANAAEQDTETTSALTGIAQVLETGIFHQRTLEADTLNQGEVLTIPYVAWCINNNVYLAVKSNSSPYVEPGNVFADNLTPVASMQCSTFEGFQAKPLTK